MKLYIKKIDETVSLYEYTDAHQILEEIQNLLTNEEIETFQVQVTENLSTKKKFADNFIRPLYEKKGKEYKKRVAKERNDRRTTSKMKSCYDADALKIEYRSLLLSLPANAQNLFWYVYKNPTRSIAQLTSYLHVTSRMVNNYLKMLYDCKLIIRQGSDRSGYYEINNEIVNTLE